MSNIIKKSVHIEDLNRSHFVYIIEGENITFNKFIRTIFEDRVYVPQKKDKLFFSPECKVPRFKIKNLYQKYNIAGVKNISSANVKIYSDDDFNCIKRSDLCTYLKEDVLKIIEASDSVFSKNVIDDVKNSTSKYVSISGYLYHHFKYFDNIDQVDDESIKAYIRHASEANNLISVINDKQCYHENSILRLINEGNILNGEQYESIKRLFESSDDKDTVLAMEAMANSDYEKSALNLLFLLQDYGRKIYACKSRKHVNFVSFLNFFDIRDVNYVYLNDIIQSLINRKLLNISNLDRLMPEITKQIDKSSPVKHISQEGLVYSDEMKKALKENILDKELNSELIYHVDEEIIIKDNYLLTEIN